MNKFLFFFFFLTVCVSAFAQSDSLMMNDSKSVIIQKKFSKENLNSYKSDKEFDYTEEKVESSPTFFSRIFNWFGRQLSIFLEWVFGVKYAKGIFAKILISLPYIIAALVLFLIIKFFLKVKSNSIVSVVKNKAIVAITEEENLINAKDILKLINQAIEQKNYRSAVRYYYLNVLKHLENKKLINWEQQKTNEDYINEISEEKLKNTFEELTRLYDFVWYGEFRINEVEFAQVQSNFEKATNLINKQ